jgi:4-amino-4-deoxy-L-arabinose transferase-like glycosyltransferase
MKLRIFVLILLFVFAGFLRVYKISSIPLGLYMDEVSVAYNAYSILETGKDEYGIAFPFAFRAFGEYKMPVFVYMTSLSMAIFGKNEFAVRIPSAFFGSITIILFYFFAKELIQYEKWFSKKQQNLFAFISAFLLAITPWHLQFSRAGFEAIVALFFFLVGLLFFLYFYRKKRNSLLFFSLLFLIVSMYSYNAFRIIGPLSVICIYVFIFFFMKPQRKVTTFTSLVAFLCALPMIFFSFTSAGQARFLQVTAFNPHVSIFLHSLEYINNYLTHFSLSFLFSYGDSIGRHNAFRMGPLFKWEIFFLIMGIYFLIKEKKSIFGLAIFFLILISPIAAAVALPSPHILRSLPLVLPTTLLVSYALVITLQQKKYLLLGIGIFVVIFEGIFYLNSYYNHAAVTLADWGGQYKELIAKLTNSKKNNAIIVINDNVGMDPVYVKFYNPKMKIITVDDSWTKPAFLLGKNVLYVTSVGEKIKNTYIHTYPHTFIDNITTPDKYHDTLYVIWKI